MTRAAAQDVATRSGLGRRERGDAPPVDVLGRRPLRLGSVGRRPARRSSAGAHGRAAGSGGSRSGPVTSPSASRRSRAQSSPRRSRQQAPKRARKPKAEPAAAPAETEVPAAIESEADAASETAGRRRLRRSTRPLPRTPSSRPRLPQRRSRSARPGPVGRQWRHRPSRLPTSRQLPKPHWPPRPPSERARARRRSRSPRPRARARTGRSRNGTEGSSRRASRRNHPRLEVQLVHERRRSSRAT